MLAGTDSPVTARTPRLATTVQSQATGTAATNQTMPGRSYADRPFDSTTDLSSRLGRAPMSEDTGPTPKHSEHSGAVPSAYRQQVH
jgi:hypothetical protein